MSWGKESYNLKITDHTPTVTLTPSQQAIVQICDEIKDMLLDKNRKYGDSAINPVRIFSKADAIEQIHVRIDDKLSRVLHRQDDDDEDVDLDLIGYFILKRACVRLQKGVEMSLPLETHTCPGIVVSDGFGIQEPLTAKTFGF